MAVFFELSDQQKSKTRFFMGFPNVSPDVYFGLALADRRIWAPFMDLEHAMTHLDQEGYDRITAEDVGILAQLERARTSMGFGPDQNNMRAGDRLAARKVEDITLNPTEYWDRKAIRADLVRELASCLGTQPNPFSPQMSRSSFQGPAMRAV